MQTASKTVFDDVSVLEEQIRQYASLVVNGESEQAEMMLQEICKMNTGVCSNSSSSSADSDDSNLYAQVGKLTRDLHESMNDFIHGNRVQMMTEEDMPDARQRLNHVVELTEKSAHKTMSLIEHSSPLLNVLAERSGLLQKQLDSHKSNSNKTALPISFSEEINAFLHLVQSTTKHVSSDLNDILLAQDYQDLTGQVIQKVSTLVQEVESNLLSLLQLQLNDDVPNVDSEDSNAVNSHDIGEKSESDNRGYGPAVPGVTKGEVMQSQADVDDLLSSLGF